jgi:hypothetical protein
MKLSREESIARYGTEAYTAWDEPSAQADASAKGINVMAKQPNPAQLTSSVSKPQFQKIKGFSDLQNQYAESVYNQPDYASLYQQYARETGLTDVKKLITDIDTSVADIEDKIARVEPNINKEIFNYDITEGQRGRMVNAEQEPLRTQYADILRSRSKLSAEASSKADLVNTLMNYAQSDYTGRVNYLKTLVDIDEANKERARTASLGNIYNYLDTKTGTPPVPTITGPEMVADRLLEGLTIDDTGTIKSSNKSSGNQQFDKSGNLILGGGMQLTPIQNNKNKNISSSTIFNRLLGNLA